MVSTIIFDKPKNLASELTHYTDIYAIDSMEFSNIVYGLSDGKFAVLKPDCAVFCPIHEVPDMAKRLIPELQAEVIAIYNDIKGLGLERVWKS